MFPELSELDISQYIDQPENVAASYTVKSAQPCVVPSNAVSSRQQHYILSRKLEVLRDCVAYIFDNKISEARKVLICSMYGCVSFESCFNFTRSV